MEPARSAIFPAAVYPVDKAAGDLRCGRIGCEGGEATGMRALPLLLALGLIVYCLIDAIQADPADLRLPKPLWLLLILLLPVVGAVAWLVAGRTRQTPERPPPGGRRRPPPPDDDPDFLRGLGGRTPPPRRPEGRDAPGEDADPDLPRA
jgi:hypothetical protein